MNIINRFHFFKSSIVAGKQKIEKSKSFVSGYPKKKKYKTTTFFNVLVCIASLVCLYVPISHVLTVYISNKFYFTRYGERASLHAFIYAQAPFIQNTCTLVEKTDYVLPRFVQQQIVKQERSECMHCITTTSRIAPFGDTFLRLFLLFTEMPLLRTTSTAFFVSLLMRQ